MSQRIELYEACQLWPIRVELVAGRWSHALWGDAGGEDDRILGDRDGFLLFTTRARLAAFLARPARTSLAGRPGLAKLRRHLRRGGRLLGTSEYDYRFGEVGRCLSTFDPERLTRAQSCDVVDCLNLLWDVASNLGDERAKAALQGRAPLARLLDVLTFHDPEQKSAPRALRALRPEALFPPYAALVGLFALRARVVA